MPPPAAFAILSDLQTRYPRELLTLAADELTGELDAARVEAVLGDVSAMIRSILLARYSRQDVERFDDDARETLRTYAMDMALYRVALSFARSSERLKEGYTDAVKALQAIAAGKGALGVVGDDAGGSVPAEPGLAGADNGTVLIEANERVFTRSRMRGL